MLLLLSVCRMNAPLERHTLAHTSNCASTHLMSAQLGGESSCADDVASPHEATQRCAPCESNQPLACPDKQLTTSSSSFLVMVASSTFSELSVVLSIVLLSTCMAREKAVAWLLVQCGNSCHLWAVS